MEKIRGILIHSAYTAAADAGDLLEGDVPEQLHHVCEVVLVLAVAGARVRLEQEVPGGELEGHAGGAPDVCRGAVTRPQDHLQRPEGASSGASVTNRDNNGKRTIAGRKLQKLNGSW